MATFFGFKVPDPPPWRSPASRRFRRSRRLVMLLGVLTCVAAFGELFLEDALGWRKLPGGSLWVFANTFGMQAALTASNAGKLRNKGDGLSKGLRWGRISLGGAGVLVFAFPAIHAGVISPSFLLYRGLLTALCFGTALAMGIFIQEVKLRERAEDQGSCPGCGYDLRATPAAGGALLARCPECGWTAGAL